ncbi:hypothetical protein [Mesorhizobium sp. B2-7-3]|uniref:hypothetical protein n=1 Tax=Mesorhizobium sp. B2-7-3 TaxID=2589907 RepID=UPI001FEF5CCA|nr:hypothetical protein [Mesorhizobium sp. B2-7-3]
MSASAQGLEIRRKPTKAKWRRDDRTPGGESFQRLDCDPHAGNDRHGDKTRRCIMRRQVLNDAKVLHLVVQEALPLRHRMLDGRKARG